LHVTVRGKEEVEGFLGGTGILMDFKDLKQLVNEAVVDRFDHQLILSKAYLEANPALKGLENLQIWDIEPSAENIILYIKQELQQGLPEDVELVKLVLYETSDSYAEWINH
jgi:6-pyruvoyltetrahydropterin/6-carboxytetrahydropterin synthase